MFELKKITTIQLELEDSQTVWDLTVDIARRRCYYLSQADGHSGDIGCIEYEKGGYTLLGEKAEELTAQSICVNQKTGDLFLGYILNNESPTYGVRIVDPRQNYQQIGLIKIPELDPDEAPYSDFNQMLFAKDRLYIYTGPRLDVGIFEPGNFQFIVCDTINNTYVQSANNFAGTTTDLIAFDSNFSIYKDAFLFLVNGYDHLADQHNLTKLTLSVYNIKENTATVMFKDDSSAFTIKGEEFKLIDIAGVDDRFNILFAFIQNEKNSAILPISLNYMGINKILYDQAIIYKKPYDGISIVFYDSLKKLIYNIYDSYNNTVGKNNALQIDPFAQVNQITYADFDGIIDSFAFDQEHKVLYVNNDTADTISVFEIAQTK